MPADLRLLAIGTDAALARPAVDAFGDAHQRQLKYASILQRYDMILRTLAGARSPITLSDAFTVHPSASRNRGIFPLDAARIGVPIARQRGSTLVSTEDPFLCGLAGFFISRRLGLPLSLQFAGDMIDNPIWMRERRINRHLNPVGKWLIQQAQTFRVVSTREREKLIGLGIHPDRVWNIGWITDFRRFFEADGRGVRDRWLTDGFDQLIVFVGRLVPQKDLFTLVKAAEQLSPRYPKARIVIVGKGHLEGELREAIRGRGLDSQVVLAGAAAYDEVPSYLAACDMMVLTTVYEGNARVLAEAGAAGKPVVTADVSGSLDTVQDGDTGYVVSVGDAEAFADRLGRLLDDPAGAAAMGRRARERVLNLYDERRLLERFQAFWELTAGLTAAASPRYAR